MNKTEYNVVGVMSGTSLDGVDLVSVKFTFESKWSFTIEASQTVPYSKYWENQLSILHGENPKQIQKTNEAYTTYLANLIKEFISDHDLRDLDAVCSHGHTLFHEPDKGITFQLGNLKKLATLIGHLVVCDFRVQDVALGGQGAPLVPIGDQLLFGNYDACLNLGGFANSSETQNKKVLAYDICAVNTVLNQFARKKGKPFDDKGKWAAKGKLIASLFEQLEALKFYKKKAPKSLGMEWVYQYLMPLMNNYAKDAIEDLLHTYTVHIAKQIGSNFKADQQVLVTGGGAKNTYLMQSIQKFSKAHFKIPSMDLVDYKEALIFGFLGVLRLRNENNCLTSVTGASRDHSSGSIYKS